MGERTALDAEFDTVLRAAQSGADWAFASLYRDFNPRLTRYFAARAPGMAEDLAADTWLEAARNLRRFDGDAGAFRAWLFTVAHCRLVQHWRRSSREAPRVAGDPAATEMAGPQDPETEVVEAMAAREAARRIASLLTADQADVVLLRVLAGLDVDQVAGILQKRPGSIRVLQHKGLRRLADRLEAVAPVTP